MSVSARALELLHLELDARLDDSDRAELEFLMKADPVVGRHREQLHEVARLLDQQAAPDLPRGFADQVMARARLPKERQAARRQRRYWQVGLALAASTIFGVVALQLLGPAAPGSSAHLSGTMAPSIPTVTTQGTEWGQRLHFRIPPGAKGRIDIRFTDGKRIVVPLAAAEDRLSIETTAGDFSAELDRGGTVTPITVQDR